MLPDFWNTVSKPRRVLCAACSIIAQGVSGFLKMEHSPLNNREKRKEFYKAVL